MVKLVSRGKRLAKVNINATPCGRRGRNTDVKLDTLEIGKDAVVASVASDDQALRQHILDMGLTPGTEVTMMKYAPMGDPLEIRLRGYELTLRKDDAARIELVDVHDTDTGPRANAAIGTTEHPALGEGMYSPRAAKTAVPEGAPLHFALAGNQNCGKTTLFNQLTGSNQHVGNFPGVTVDRKDGTIRNHPEASVTDLPGIYSLSPYTGEEIVSRQFILDENPDAIIDIIDATNIERNLYLTLQLMELDRPMVIALNMMDEVTANGGAVDVNLLESLLGVPVVPISAARNEGIGELVDHALHVARFRERPGRLDFCAPDGSDGGAFLSSLLTLPAAAGAGRLLYLIQRLFLFVCRNGARQMKFTVQAQHLQYRQFLFTFLFHIRTSLSIATVRLSPLGSRSLRAAICLR